MKPVDLDAYMAEIAQAKPWADEPGVGSIVMDALEIAELVVAELRAARECVDRVRDHVLNDEIYCARCMEALVAYQKATGLPITDPKTTRTYTGQFTAEVER